MPQKYFSAEAIEALATPLIGQYHSEIATARIKFVFAEKAGMKGGAPVLGKSRKLSGVLEHLVGADFVIEVAMDQWNNLPAPQRLALVDHLLECCTGEEDGNDPAATPKWSIREPEMREFGTILNRHGAWNSRLEEVVSIAQRLNTGTYAANALNTETAQVSTHN